MGRLRDQSPCGIDELLTYLINRVSSCPQAPPSLEQCLDGVLDVANSAVVQSRFAQHTTLSGKESRSERCIPFIVACNTALIELRKKDFPGLRPPSTLMILFHALGSGASARRTPEICCISWHIAKTHRTRGSCEPTSPEAFMVDQALRVPAQSLHWNELLSPVDVKISKRSALSAVRVRQSRYATTSSPETVVKPRGVETGHEEPVTASAALSVGTSTYSASTGGSSYMDEDEDYESSSAHISAYGIEILCCRPGITHTFGLVVHNNHVHVWLFDRQGAIQSFGLDIVDDLPRFLILLLVFDRFELLDWGVNPALDRQCQIRHCGLAEEEVSLDVTTYVPASRGTADKQAVLPIRILHPPIFGRYKLSGRCTQIYPATTTINDAQVEVVVKISWVEEVRTSEVEILKRASAVADDAVQGHIPQIFGSRDFPESSTGNIRRALGIVTEAEKKSTTSRILRAIVFSRLRPITDLVGNDFLKAFFDCFQCHHALWKNNIRHCDLSLNNLMVDSKGRGVMNDWDLAMIHGEGNPHGLDRAGTLPYMPLEFLTREFMDGKVERFYRHEAEGFVWILVVACRRFNNGKEVEDPTSVDKWFSGDYEAVYSAKSSCQNKLVLPKGQPSYRAQFYVARSLVWWLDEDLKKRTTQWRKSGSHVGPPQDDTAEGPYKAWWKAVEDVIKISKDEEDLEFAGENRHLLEDLGNFLVRDMAVRGVTVK